MLMLTSDAAPAARCNGLMQFLYMIFTLLLDTFGCEGKQHQASQSWDPYKAHVVI